MNLFDRLLNRRLCNEQPADGGAAPAPSDPAPATPAPGADPSAPAGTEPPAADPAKPAADPEKPEGEKPADGDKPDGEKKPGEKKPEGAPEKYEFTPAEGQQLDAAALEQFEPIARELNLTNDQAQKMVDLYGSQILPMVQKQQAEAWQQTTEQWAADVKADKEIGGDKLTANIGVAQRALDTFGTPDLKEYLNSTGLGNHPGLIKFCVKVGQAMSEDKVVTGGHDGGSNDLVSAFYPKK